MLPQNVNYKAEANVDVLRSMPG